MIIISICAVAMFVLAMRFCYTDSDLGIWPNSGVVGKTLLVIFTPVIGIIGLAFGGLLGAIVAGAIGLAVPYHWSAPHRESLLTLRSTDGVEGHFFLGSGAVGTHIVYAYYTLSSDGKGFTPHTLDADTGVNVYEDSKNAAYLEWQERSFAQDWYGHFALPVMAGKSWISFHVPPGTVKRNYHLE